MNYKNVAKKKKKNTAIIVVASILALVLAGGAVAGLGFHFDWWGAEEAPAKKEVPTSTYNLEIGSLDDLLGVEFTYDDYTNYFSTFALSQEELLELGAIGSLDEKLDTHHEWFVSILNVDDYGIDFDLPEEGQYEVTLKINGVEYTTDYAGVPDGEGENGPVFAFNLFLDEDYQLVDVGLGEEADLDAGMAIQFMLFNKVTNEIDGSIDDLTGYSFLLVNEIIDVDGSGIETFELVSFERIGDFPIGE